MHLQTVLRRVAPRVPRLRGVVIDPATTSHRELVVRCEFVDEPPFNWLVEERDVYDLHQVWGVDLREEIRSIWSRLAEDRTFDREVRKLSERYKYLRRAGAPAAMVRQARDELEYRVQLLQAHRGPARRTSSYFGVDTGGPDDTAMVTVHMGRQQLDVVHVDELASIDHATFVALHEQARRSIDRAFALDARYFEPRHWGGPAGGGMPSEAEQKGIKLLREWLSPEQLAQYDRDKHFDVVGGDTGTRYRIHHGRQQNIHELHTDGGSKQGWCFLPEGQLVAGDCMLAQKIALETMERRALKKANPFPVGLQAMDLRPGAVNWRPGYWV